MITSSASPARPLSYTDRIDDRHLAPDSSRALLTTVLGEFVLPTGGTVWTQTLIELLAALGVREKAARQTIARLHERGWLDRERIGRRTRWQLTKSSRTLLEEGAERIYGFRTASDVWAGEWLLLLATVPERDRADRHRMNIGLRWAGFGSLRPGVWISPWPEREHDAAGLLDGLGIDATTFRAELGALGVGADVVAEAWDLESLRAEYDAFLRFVDGLDSNAAGREAAAQLTMLVHAWRRFPTLDPELPAALLPGSWPAAEAAERFAAARKAVLDPALTWWEMLESNRSSEGVDA